MDEVARVETAIAEAEKMLDKALPYVQTAKAVLQVFAGDEPEPYVSDGSGGITGRPDHLFRLHRLAQNVYAAEMHLHDRYGS